LLSNIITIKIPKTVILLVVLYGCGTSFVTLRDERRLRAFENRVLWRILGSQWDEVTGEWRRLQNVELYYLYSSPDTIRVIKSRRMRLGRGGGGPVAHMGDRRGVYRILVGETGGKETTWKT
jgi:hypothetical protein